MITDTIVYQILIFFGLQAIIFIVAMISIAAIQCQYRKLKIVSIATYTALKALRSKDPIFYNSVIMALPELEKKIVTEMLTPPKPKRR